MKLHDSESPKVGRRHQKLIILVISLTAILTIIPLYFPYSHQRLLLSSSFVGHPESTVITPTPRRSRHSNTSTEHPNFPLNHTTKEEIRGPSELNISYGSKSGENTNDGRGRGRGHVPVRPKAASLSPGKKCDLFSGQWVANPEAPYYTNATCEAIQEHQNCMKFGRPDLGFLKWRWRPDGCELPVFNPRGFLELMRGKSLAFVGDSIARNHMQSLICLLSRIAHPLDASKHPTDGNRLYQYTAYDFSVSIISSPYLIRSTTDDFTRPFNLFLDEFDESWTSRIPAFDYIVISAGQWFRRPTYFYLNRNLVGCLYCPEPNVTHLNSSFSYRWAFRTALSAVNGVRDFKGVAFVRTLAPSHFEGGSWDRGGDCVRTAPFGRNGTGLELEEYAAEMYRIQLEEVGIARRGTGGRRVRVFDVTKAMAMRPDGHPRKYGRLPPVANQTFANDCVHWCLPGPIDAWNDLLQELVRRDTEQL